MLTKHGRWSGAAEPTERYTRLMVLRAWPGLDLRYGSDPDAIPPGVLAERAAVLRIAAELEGGA